MFPLSYSAGAAAAILEGSSGSSGRRSSCVDQSRLVFDAAHSIASATLTAEVLISTMARKPRLSM
ncbi:hypothetical protein CQW49_04115 [Methylosinus trichosporium OB3b]|uniref:Uncharacterized protein n=1 Tax=Methylosinus trichosporium (strain ATCC 35070 / NCIMB 11131 / UNIQEM 75 / OB3b) TaxID=595536 RepID=A0A2D2CWN9_METT3|nr:hypothetical protein CQW49_04115 [Methylosinus trichosporium OB3b]OBS52688.1 hypothetical protein A8B73_09405 [Methylosinus sp. 3S-1]